MYRTRAAVLNEYTQLLSAAINATAIMHRDSVIRKYAPMFAALVSPTYSHRHKLYYMRKRKKYRRMQQEYHKQYYLKHKDELKRKHIMRTRQEAAR